MILMPQIFDVIANENARYKRNELELLMTAHFLGPIYVLLCINMFMLRHTFILRDL